MTAQIIMFVPRPNPDRKEPPAFDYSLDHSTLIQAQADPEMPCDVGFHPTDCDPA